MGAITYRDEAARDEWTHGDLPVLHHETTRLHASGLPEVVLRVAG